MNDTVHNPKQLGYLIRRARNRKGWTQKILGEKARLRQETISFLENGNPKSRISTVLTALAALGLEVQIAAVRQGPLTVETVANGESIEGEQVRKETPNSTLQAMC